MLLHNLGSREYLFRQQLILNSSRQIHDTLVMRERNDLLMLCRQPKQRWRALGITAQAALGSGKSN
jgi:hypothetical protein